MILKEDLWLKKLHFWIFSWNLKTVALQIKNGKIKTYKKSELSTSHCVMKMHLLKLTIYWFDKQFIKMAISDIKFIFNSLLYIPIYF